jgi:chorismate dehydratase
MIKVSVVSYLNAIPFIFGLENSMKNLVDIALAVPSATVQQFQNGQCDIALISAAALPNLANYNLITNYCISAYKKVDSVLLFSNTVLKNVNKVWLDSDSVTSNLLCKVLLNEHWNLNTNNFEYGSNDILQEGEAKLEIGNKALMNRYKYKYQYDLATEWYNFCGLPMVFAVWLASKHVSNETITQFNEALGKGVAAITTVTEQLIKGNQFPNIDIAHYLNNCIDYEFDSTKQAALSLYLQKIKNYK